MLAALSQRNFALLWTAGLISMTGNWMLAIALPVIVYQITGSALAVSGLVLAGIVPTLLFSSVAGVFIDRWERRRTMITVNLLLALSILPLLLVQSADTLFLIYIVRFFQSTLNQFFAPAENAMLPLLSRPELLVSANALNALNNNLARLIGPAVGGVVAASVGLSGVVLIDILTYLLAALLTMAINVTPQPAQEDTGTARALAPAALANEWADGFRLLWRERTIRILFVMNALTSVGESVMSVLFVPFVTHVLAGQAVDVGGLMSAQAVGGILGGLVISGVARRIRTVYLLGVSAVLFGLVDLALFNYSTFMGGILPAYAFILLAGPLAVGMGASYATLMQSQVDDRYRGRVFGALGLTESLFMLVGIVVSGLAGDTVGIVPVINIQGYAYITAGLICLAALKTLHIQRSVPAMQEA